MNSKKRIERLEAVINSLTNKADPNLCSRCGTDCKTFNQEWFESKGEQVYDDCMTRHVVLKGPI